MTIRTDLLTIGDEILIGQIVDTNSAWLGEQMTQAGFHIRQITSVSDSRVHILESLRLALESSDVVIVTGGLGPTNDDITTQCLAEYFGSRLIPNQEVLRHIEGLLGRRGVPMNELNRKQAEVPHNCIPLTNRRGTAPGLWFDQGKKVLVALPGVPFEMKGLMEEEVLPRLVLKFKPPALVYRTIWTIGLPESVLATRIAEWEQALPRDMKLAYLPQPGLVRLRLGMAGSEADPLISKAINQLQALIPEHIFGAGEDSLEEVVGKGLRQSGSTLCTAESCTGGYLSHLITRIPGSSDYYLGSVVAYSNAIKEKILGVAGSTLAQHGAVSRETAEAMATGVRNLFQADFSLAITGIAGPGGGSPEKPVGSVWVATAGRDFVESRLLRLGTLRENNIRMASLQALNMLRTRLKSQ